MFKLILIAAICALAAAKPSAISAWNAPLISSSFAPASWGYAAPLGLAPSLLPAPIISAPAYHAAWAAPYAAHYAAPYAAYSAYSAPFFYKK